MLGVCLSSYVMIKVYNANSFILSLGCGDISEHAIETPENHSKEGNNIHNNSNV